MFSLKMINSADILIQTEDLLEIMTNGRADLFLSSLTYSLTVIVGSPKSDFKRFYSLYCFRNFDSSSDLINLVPTSYRALSHITSSNLSKCNYGTAAKSNTINTLNTIHHIAIYPISY